MSSFAVSHWSGRGDQTTTVQGPSHELITLVYHELRKLAHKKMRAFGRGMQTLQPTALVHEAYMRLANRPKKRWKGRRHFYHAAGLAMRHILIERARSKMARSNGGDWQRVEFTVDLADGEGAVVLGPDDVLTLDRALARMHREYPHLVEIVLMRYYCGLTMLDIAGILGLSLRTLERKWRFARGWLCNELKGLAVRRISRSVVDNLDRPARLLE
ncbi:MAG: ECF-type sigma factor [Proteobacteria bacterium]|nr:ECF-type sigma factor [Pseudomonadota bacterium]